MNINNTKTTMKTIYCSWNTLSALVALVVLASGLAEVATTKKFEPRQLREDFQIARQSLEEGQPGLYRHTKKAELDRIFDEAEKSLDHPMDAYEFYRLMAPTIAAIKCGHTGVSTPPELRAEIESLPWLPFGVKVLESKAYIFRDYAKGGVLAGKEIQSINGVTSARIISTMVAASMKDGDVQTSRQRDISGDFSANLLLLLGLRAPFEVVLRGPESSTSEKVQFAGLKHDEQIQISKRLYPHDEGSKHFADLKFFDDGQIAHLTYSSFGTTVEEGHAFMQRSFEAIHAKGSRALILDVRGNGGGEDELGKFLFSYLVDAPFIYYEDLIATKLRFSFAKYTDPHRDLNIPEGVAELRSDGRVHLIKYDNLGLQQSSKPTFAGPVYVLIDGGCLSTTAEFLTEVHFRHRGTFIGEESAGCYYGPTSGDVVKIALPNTKMGIFIPVVSYYMAVGGLHDHDPARGIIPDYPVKRTITDLLAGTDRELETALQLARKSR